jgi:predicted negative regulator of RcsB-dependent stress response
LGSGRETVLHYWSAIAKALTSSPKSLLSAIALITWEIWKERNARVFNNKAYLVTTLMEKIKDEGKDWIMTGANCQAEIVG